MWRSSGYPPWNMDYCQCRWLHLVDVWVCLSLVNIWFSSPVFLWSKSLFFFFCFSFLFIIICLHYIVCWGIWTSLLPLENLLKDELQEGIKGILTTSGHSALRVTLYHLGPLSFATPLNVARSSASGVLLYRSAPTALYFLFISKQLLGIIWLKIVSILLRSITWFSTKTH